MRSRLRRAGLPMLLSLICIAFFNAATLTAAAVPTENLQLWLRADEGVNVDTAGQVTLWLDQSDKGNHAQSTGSGPLLVQNRVNGKPALAFNGQSSFLVVPNAVDGGLNADDAFSIITVYRFDQGSNLSRVMQKRSNAVGTGYDAWFVAAGRGLGVANSRAMQDVYASGPDFFVHTGVFDLQAGHLSLYLNGKLMQKVEPMAPQTPNSHPLFIGKREHNPNLAMKGEIAEILIYKSALTDEQRAAIEAYLLAKFGLQP